jgi:hypothetical protein
MSMGQTDEMKATSYPLAFLKRRELVSLARTVSMEGRGQKAICSG